jgi:secondary thiamine-phosphate synthase enzyme
MVETIEVKSKQKRQVLEITDPVQEKISAAKVESGVCTIFVEHTTAAVTTGEFGEGTDEDLLETMEKIIPKINFRHLHNPAHAPEHMISSILGTSLTVPILGGKLALGHWQRILLVELSGPRSRSVVLHISS